MDAVDIEARRQEAEREVRRGSFQRAIATYEALVREAPADAALAERLEALRGLLQPMETASPKAAAGAGAPTAESDVQKGEEAANKGDLPTAIAAYRRVVAADPANDLMRERLEELVRLARAAGLGAPPAAGPHPSAVPAPAPTPAPDPVVMLEGLLARVRSRRR